VTKNATKSTNFFPVFHLSFDTFDSRVFFTEIFTQHKIIFTTQHI
jgi:hypothetical protein